MYATLVLFQLNSVHTFPSPLQCLDCLWTDWVQVRIIVLVEIHACVSKIPPKSDASLTIEWATTPRPENVVEEKKLVNP